jgi:hypothetical protein
MELVGDLGHVESHFDPFGDSVVSLQDGSSVCINVTLAQKSFRMHPMVLLGDEALVDAFFDPFGDSANPYAR